jgi:signal transduction histidine kinase
MRSLEGRLQLGLTLSLLVLIGGAWWLGHLALHSTADAFVLSRLQHDAEALLAGVAWTPDPQAGAPRLALSARTSALAIYDRPHSGHYYIIQPESGEPLRSRSLWDHDLAVPTLATGETSTWHAPGPEGQRLLVWAGGFASDGHAITLATAEDDTPLTQAVDGFERSFALIALAGLALAMLVQRLVVRRAFARLKPVYAEIARLEQGAVGRLTETVPTELWPLVHKINRLLGSYAQRLERTRQTAGNIAHTLKGPLSVLNQQIERDEARLPPGLARALRDQVRDIGQRIDRELKRTRLAGAVSPGRHFDPAADLPALTDLLRRIYRDKDLEIEAEAPRGTFPADREDMLELLGLLADNACKWAKTRVRLTLGLDGSVLSIRIEDDGPGCPDQDLEALTQRGVRLDEAVSGHGLGLAIAQEVVELYGGKLTLARSQALGGFEARVQLPNPGTNAA